MVNAYQFHRERGIVETSTSYIYVVDGELKIIFFSALTIDAFDPPEHKSHFDFTLAHPRNVQIQFLEFVKKKIEK